MKVRHKNVLENEENARCSDIFVASETKAWEVDAVIEFVLPHNFTHLSKMSRFIFPMSVSPLKNIYIPNTSKFKLKESQVRKYNHSGQ